MTITTKNSHDVDIQESVVDELQWTPAVDPSHIGVSVHDGAVTLSGEVNTYSERLAARKAALHVKGVSVIADDLAVRSLTSTGGHTDTDLAARVQNILRWTASVPQGAIKAEVRDGVVWLTGTVDWDFQRQAARKAIEGIAGIRRVDLGIALTQRASASDTAKKIKAALVRSALVEASAIKVTASGADVTLTGTVRTWDEKAQAGRAAWSSPHVRIVHNSIAVKP